ncbi:hypothetical protein G7046_g8073 [Stylonectria norvegica]|nr:hypothetical protein G7046_g8073 [Stylonectria norvegica]
MTSPKGSILVTGANGGLGSAIVSHILKTPELASNYIGLYTVRKEATATKLKSVLQSAPASHKNEIVGDFDLGSLASVRETAATINRRVAAGELPPIRALILNAGYQDHEELNMTGDGFEATWQINHLANMLLTLLLLQSMDKNEGRILIVGSWSHDINDERNKTGGGDPFKGYTTLFPGAEALAKGKWSTPQDEGGWLTGFRRYAASKLCVVMFMHDLGDRLVEDPELSKICVIGLDPGAMGTDLLRKGSFVFRTLMSKVFFPLVTPVTTRLNPNGSLRTVYKSAADIVRACFEIEAPLGAMYLNGSDVHWTSDEVGDDEKREELWKYSVAAAGLKPGDTVLRDWQ